MDTLTLHVGLIGYGYWGKNLLRNLKEHAAVGEIHVADTDEEKLRQAVNRYADVKAYTDYREILENPSISAVLIATPGASHFPIAKEALAAGKHVFVEKPMVTRVADAHVLMAMAAEKKLVISVDHTFLYNDAVRQIKELIAQGLLGEISYLESTRINLGIYQQDVNVVWDLASHDLSIINYIIDEKPLYVRAIGKKNHEWGVVDLAYLFLEYPSGMLVQISSSWASPVKIRKMLIGGQKKMIIYDDIEATDKIKIYDYENVPSQQNDREKLLVDYRLGGISIPKLELSEPLQNAVDDFLSCIRHGGVPLSGAEQALEVVKILEAADRSLSNNGERVSLS